MSVSAPTDPLPVAPRTTLRLLLVLAYVLAGHVARLPIWIDLLVAALLVWRAGVALRDWPTMPRGLRLTLALAAVAGVLLTYGRINGQSAGLALLGVMLGGKLTELDTRRDHRVLVFFAFFLLATHFLFTQSLLMLPYAAGGALALTMLMVDLSHPGSALHLRTLLPIAGRALLSALPLMLVMFILFPRIPGPLWGLPNDAGAARSGLSQSMSPGDISSLALSDAVAFRAAFSDAMPAPEQRYWRGPVFWFFDGRRWSPGSQSRRLPAPRIEPRGTRYRYHLTIEPNRQHWLFALERPLRWPHDAEIGSSGSLRAEKALKERRRVTLTSAPAARLDGNLAPRARELALQLPLHGNPRARELAKHWRERGWRGRQLIAAGLGFFRRHDFVYTLTPPALGRDSVDEFLFETRRGFCEHFASAFTMLMRAAGLPARVVTGYQGGEPSIDERYLIVRQSNAHAWSEVYLPQRGWTRVDPTASVVPERVETSLQSALVSAGQRLSAPSRREALWHSLRLQVDWINNTWNRFVLGYGPQLQGELLSPLGLGDPSRMIMALTIACALLLGLGGILMLRGLWSVPEDPVQRAWQALGKRLARRGLAKRDSEGPRDYIQRAMRHWPADAAALGALYRDYTALRYGGKNTERQRRERFLQAARRFRPTTPSHAAGKAR